MTTTMISQPTVMSFAALADTTAMMMREIAITDTSGSTFEQACATLEATALITKPKAIGTSTTWTMDMSMLT